MFFRYRTLCWSIDLEFYEEYILEHAWLVELAASSEGAGTSTEVDWGRVETAWVSSAKGFLERWWPRLHGGDIPWERYQERLGCYNLPRGGDGDHLRRYAFWHYDWGAPHQVYLWTCRLLDVTSHHIQYAVEASDDTLIAGYGDLLGSDGFGVFVRNLILGRSQYSREAADHCYLSVEFRNNDPTWPAPLSTLCGYDHPTCDVGGDPGGPLACTGQYWNQWGSLSPTTGGYDAIPTWIPSNSCFNGDYTTTSQCRRPQTGCSYHGYQSNFSTNYHPSELAFQGAVCDHILYLARMLSDYGDWLQDRGRDFEAESAIRVCGRMSKYALIVMAMNARHWLHEIGHAWLTGSTEVWPWPGAHCNYNCANDIAANHWLCRVRADLGLPILEYQPNGTDDFSPTANSIRQVGYCGGDATAAIATNCVIEDPGVEESRSWFCSTGCEIPVMSGAFAGLYTPDLTKIAASATYFNNSTCDTSWATF